MRVCLFFFCVVAAGCGGGRLVDNGADIGDVACSDDDGCVLVASTCGCSRDGVVVAVPASKEVRVADELSSAICNDLISDDIGCFADDAICDGTCRLHIADEPVRRR